MGIGKFNARFQPSKLKHLCSSLQSPRRFSRIDRGDPLDANPAMRSHKAFYAFGTGAPFRGMSHVESASI